jgi:integrase
MTENASTFTTKFVAAAKPKLGPDGTPQYTEYSDAISPLRLAVQSSGHRRFIVRYRRPDDSKPAKLTLASDITLASARHAATAAMLQLERGIDPSPRRALFNGHSRSSSDTIEAAVAAFLDLHVRRKNRASTAQAAERIFGRLVLPVWRRRTVQDIRKRDIIDLVESIATDRPYLANRTLAILSKFFSWLVGRDRLALSPATGVERPHREQARSHTLNDDELRRLWLACEGDAPFGPALHLLILGGGRRNEVSQMRWSELDMDQRLWRLPRERCKNNRPYAIPLPSQAWTILEALPRINGGDYVFTTDGRTPINGWSKAKARISAKAGIDEASWRLHDLRRSCAAGMQRLGVSVPVVEKALNHVSGAFRGIVSTYQTHDYADETRIAFQRWGDHVERLVGGKPAKVVTLRGRRR